MLLTRLLVVFMAVFVVRCQVDWSADEDPEKWRSYSKNRLQQSLNRKLNGNLAKNLIMFLGDGMGPSTVTSGRILVGQVNNQNGEEVDTNIDKFDHVALAKVRIL